MRHAQPRLKSQSKHKEHMQVSSQPHQLSCPHCAQIHALEHKGGSILGGVLAARRQAKKEGLQQPKLAEQDVALPAKPKGQTVVSFRRGMQSLPLAMADQLKDVLRCARQGPAVQHVRSAKALCCQQACMLCSCQTWQAL